MKQQKVLPKEQTEAWQATAQERARSMTNAATTPADIETPLRRYQVYGYYTDEPQVVIDIVDARSDEEAIEIITKARGGNSGGYENDGAGLLADELTSLQAVLTRSAEDVERDVQALASNYAAEHEGGLCRHRTLYWINRTNLNWRCTDQCGFQFFGTTPDQAWRRARRDARKP